MINSMTGYGRFEGKVENKRITCEIKSVNHRYFDLTVKVPRHYGFLEEKVRSYISKFITRGKVDVYIIMESYDDTEKQIVLNEALAANYIDALTQLRDRFNLVDDIKTSVVSRYSDIFVTQRKEEDQEGILNITLTALEPALSDFLAMRKREGERLSEDIKSRFDSMLDMVEFIEERSPQTVAEYHKRLLDKLNEVLKDKNIDEARIVTEAAIFADKVAVAEETVRLKSHFKEALNVVDDLEPSGRKLDFIIQEINREINTIGSKANDLAISKMVVNLKAELEKIREQVQNVE